ncbi:MAG: glycosyltransferase [Rhodocyclaceae bacterium]|nr:glycosyltransferase [Rhodocyclaceae bacterium]MBX3669574.1 glycosyltransferase [Rhodocyclaceae bacterium]
MHFALVLTNLSGGGAEKAMLKMAALLAGRGHAVDVVLLEDRREHAPPPGVRLRALVPAGKLSHGWLGKRRAAWRLRRQLLAGPPPDLIVSTLPFADEIAHIARLPRHWCRIANTLGAEIALLARHGGTKAARRRHRYTEIYGAHPLIAVSQGVADDLRATFDLRNRIEAIPNPFDVAAIRARAAEEAAGLPARPFVLHVGRFATQKRHDLLLDAWVALPAAPDLVLLTAPEPALQAMIDVRGLSARVHIAGFQSNPYPWMAAARLLVLCSDHEGLPNVLLEALACGTPVVSTDCPSGPAEILRNLPECLVPCGNLGALTQAIERQLAAPADCSRVDFSNYAPACVAAAWEALACGPGA